MERLVMQSALLLVVAGLSLFASASVAQAQEEKKIVAVLPFASPNNHMQGKMGHNAQPTFITELVKSKKVRVVDEKRATDAVKRFEREMTGLYDQKKLRQIGRFLKVDYLISGQISWAGDAYTMTVHVTNVETLELEMAEDVDFRDEGKFRVAVRTAAKKIAGVVSGQEVAKGRHEAFLNMDPRHFYDTADACVKALKGLGAWKYEGEIDEEGGSAKKVHVKLRHGKPKPGTPLQVFEDGMGDNDKPIGMVYVLEPDEKGSGFVAQWIKEQDKTKKKRGDFGLGARVSNTGYRYRIAVGELVDEAEDKVELVDMFRDKLNETFEESDMFLPKDDSKVLRLAADLGRGATKKKNLEQLHGLGVDFILTGKFIGSPGQRRADFKIISAMTGEVWGTLKFETRI